MILLSCCLLFASKFSLECGSSYQHQQIGGVRLSGGSVSFHTLDREGLERVSSSARNALRDFRVSPDR